MNDTPPPEKNEAPARVAIIDPNAAPATREQRWSFDPHQMHAPNDGEFFPMVQAVQDAIRANCCCNVHGAHAAVMAAVAQMAQQHGDRHDAIRKAVLHLVNVTMNKLRTGEIRFQSHKVQ